MDGKLISVPSVKELAKGDLERVPDRYVVPYEDHDRPIIQSDHDGDDLDQVPIINMEALLAGDKMELHKLHCACQEWGFFQLINRGTSTCLLEKFKSETQTFFNLSIEERRKYWQSQEDMEGLGQLFVVSEEQRLDWADVFFLSTLPMHQRSARLFPILPLPFRDTLENYSLALHELARKILDCMANALNIDTEIMRGMLGEIKQSLRINCYPPCPQPEKAIGLTPHSDAAALTILLQLNEMVGLQINKDGKWVPIKPLPNAFVINVGDTLEIFTNGIYRSVLHRAMVNATKERLSVATFHSPPHEHDIYPLLNFVAPNASAKFKRIRMADYYKGYLARQLDGKSYLNRMRINNANDENPMSHNL